MNRLAAGRVEATSIANSVLTVWSPEYDIALGRMSISRLRMLIRFDNDFVYKVKTNAHMPTEIEKGASALVEIVKIFWQRQLGRHTNRDNETTPFLK